ncbi:TetR family transcriptional regulator [Ideonella sp. 4Y16]|uniref:TetR family transcriptional regulator n=1 Tax=Ideonella alba TaxID=2824118 RepID=A0A941BDY1_9BURK|nr:TetR/AcrR family transcriptional regulator [Ideonella alba]MBQ0929387.1 TetR family transcriptional regulator [Ideonella alba]MBQ0945498.1 TetR family transcriptional regulator [Ideonella alba]
MNQTVHPAPKPARKRGRPAAVPADAADSGRTNDPERTMADILEVATAEFAAKGLAGARIDEIAALTRTSKRMIYYYFESKEGLYVHVLEAAYARIRRIESELHLENLEPERALRTLVAFTYDYQLANPDFIRLVMNENMHRGEYLARSTTIRRLNVPAIAAVEEVYRRGVASGAFRPDVDPVDLHMSISALCFFNVSNRHTFSLIFGRELDSPAAVAARRESIVEMIVRHVRR